MTDEPTNEPKSGEYNGVGYTITDTGQPWDYSQWSGGEYTGWMLEYHALETATHAAISGHKWYETKAIAANSAPGLIGDALRDKRKDFGDGTQGGEGDGGIGSTGLCTG